MNPKTLSLLFALFFATACSQSHTTDVQDTLDEFNTAFARGNPSVISAFVSDDYTHTNGSSAPIGKKSWLKYLEGRYQQIQSGELKIHSYEMTEQQIELVGTVALVTGRVHTIVEKAGKSETRSFRVTQIWTFENGRWVRVGFHDGRIED